MMRFSHYFFACVGSVGLFAASAYADLGCEERLGTLNDRFTVDYVNLESECYPQNDEIGASPECGFNLTPECQAKYEALGLEVSSAWEEFFAACPNFLPPTISDDVPQSVAGNERFQTRKPITRAPSKKDLLNRVSKLQKRVKALNKSLRNAKRARQTTERRCRNQ